MPAENIRPKRSRAVGRKTKKKLTLNNGVSLFFVLVIHELAHVYIFYKFPVESTRF
ncbi:hypothetical protein GCM10009001_23570 [Virgibacillus siamensis]|uniref:Uncharacterized protein n=1 Tax=Virgibacillus siamensis TaxID=480071 RepID=A0ABN1G7R9_9BACI